jgi:protein-tyrosine phosphatase
VAPRHAVEAPGELQQLNLGLVIDMLATRPPPRKLQVPALWLRTFDFPLLPIPLRTLHRGVKAALPVIQAGRGVLVYCQGGRHRSVAMASAILIAMGYTAQDAMELVSKRRSVADPWAGHIQRQIRRFEMAYRE